MNLRDALNKNRPFRRIGSKIAQDGIWLSPHTFDEFTRVEVLADDWEVQEPAVTITRTQFNDAVQHAIRAEAIITDSHRHTLSYSWNALSFIMSHMAKNLGLE